MLDPQIIAQLESVFGALESDVDLVARQSDHEQQRELLTLLGDVADTSERVSLRVEDAAADVPSFRIDRGGLPTGISFVGIPGGHEFTSLVLSIPVSYTHLTLPTKA